MSEQSKTKKEWLQILKERDYPAARERVGEAIDEYVPTDVGKQAANVVADVYMPENDLDLAMSLFPAAKVGKLFKKVVKAMKAGGAGEVKDAKKVVGGPFDKPAEKPKTIIEHPFGKPKEQQVPSEVRKVIFKGERPASPENKDVVMKPKFRDISEDAPKYSPPSASEPAAQPGENVLDYRQMNRPSRIAQDKQLMELESERKAYPATRRGEVQDEKLAHRIRFTKPRN